MQLPRRGFLKTGALTAVSAGLAIGGARLASAQRPAPSRNTAAPGKTDSILLSFTSETFHPYVGDYFQAPNARGEMVSLKLTQVLNYKAKNSSRISTRMSPELRSFSLTFEASEKLPQFTSIHKVSHPALGEFDLFLSPRELEDGTMIYEAVFSHL